MSKQKLTIDQKKRKEEWDKYIKGGRKGMFPPNAKKLPSKHTVDGEPITLETIWNKLTTIWDRVQTLNVTDYGTYRIPSDEYYEYQRLKRKYEVEKIDLSKVGLITVDTKDLWIKHAIYQAKLDNIAEDESGLCVREIFADLDLQDVNRNEIKSRDWRFPVKGGYKESDVWEVIYDGSVDAMRKVILFTGYHTLSKQIYINSVSFDRASVKIIEFQSADTLPVNFGRVMLPTPVMYKKNDRPRIRVHVSNAGKGHIDKIALSGLVVEPLGNYMTG